VEIALQKLHLVLMLTNYKAFLQLAHGSDVFKRMLLYSYIGDRLANLILCTVANRMRSKVQKQVAEHLPLAIPVSSQSLSPMNIEKIEVPRNRFSDTPVWVLPGCQ
jgi:hypothetical protein